MSYRQGFTLLELLIYMAIIGVISVVITSAIISLNRGQGFSKARSDVTSNLRFATEKINQDLKGASAVTTPASAGASASTLVMTVSGNTITYDVSAGQLRRQVNADTPAVITSTSVTVASPTFTRLENTNTVLSKTIINIQADLSISYNSSSPDYQYSERKVTAMSLR